MRVALPCFGLVCGVDPLAMEALIVDTFRGTNALFGSATAAYQVEGGRFKTTGKLNSGDIAGELRATHIWDDFSRNTSLYGNNTADVAVDFFNKWQEDVALVQSLNFNAFRFSISWARLVNIDPATKEQTINADGLRYYQGLVDELRAKGVEPVVTMFHWDLPTVFVDYSNLTAHGGMNDPEIVGHFETYAKLILSNLKRVKYFTTFNEPQTICVNGYGQGVFAPGLKTNRDMYQCGHQLLRSHARMVAAFRETDLPKQGGKISINLNQDMMYPRDETSAEDRAAAERQLVFRLAWWADPIFKDGDYPEEMRAYFKEQHLELHFTEEEKKMLKGSADFYAMQHYSSLLCTPAREPTPENLGVDCNQEGTAERGWWASASSWLKVNPEGIQKMLLWIHNRYRPESLVITENGVDDEDTGSAAGPTESCGALDDPARPGQCGACTLANLKDEFRVEYYRGYVYNVALAAKAGVKITGYFAWSLLDNFEWADGFRCRFGLVCVNYTSATKDRTPKSSALWWKSLLQRIRESTTVV
mmetsp:Transcript_34642/g.83663  ORF Transcript_34642/g.83663 Transcript_34642/m.83663 type:complete len:532 (+) Transcript_34642:29-1624(+)